MKQSGEEQATPHHGKIRGRARAIVEAEKGYAIVEKVGAGAEAGRLREGNRRFE